MILKRQRFIPIYALAFFMLSNISNVSNATLTENLNNLNNKTSSFPTLLYTVSGTAYDQKSEQIIYKEQHEYYSDLSHLVTYQDVDGKTFATKTINYLADSATDYIPNKEALSSPNVIQENKWANERINITRLDNQAVLVNYELDNRKSISKKIKQTDNLVIDAGFDLFIQSNWAALSAGETLVMDYLLPTRASTVALRVEPISSTTANTTANKTTSTVRNALTNNTSSASQALESVQPPQSTNQPNQPTPKSEMTLRLDAKNPVLRAFSQAINLTYNTHNQRLIQFSGKSNIADKSGNYPEVTINYVYSNNL